MLSSKNINQSGSIFSELSRQLEISMFDLNHQFSCYLRVFDLWKSCWVQTKFLSPIPICTCNITDIEVMCLSNQMLMRKLWNSCSHAEEKKTWIDFVIIYQIDSVTFWHSHWYFKTNNHFHCYYFALNYYVWMNNWTSISSFQFSN